MTWETVIGLETHVELSTATKIFCSCTTAFGGEPNTHCCPVCTGMPGALPVLNERVLDFALRTGLALGCDITRSCQFDRKNYFYPDLPKAYQVSQLYLPIARNGRVPIRTDGGVEKVIGIHELHMEEDAGKLVHDPWIDETRCDYNRCGVPLIEIVTEPDFRSAEEVIAYLEKLISTLRYLGVSDCKMQEGSLRCDVNLSVRPAGSTQLGTRTEMKNINSFKAIAKAIAYESRRQIERIEEGKRVIQETRRWDDNKDATFAMRSKEDAQDYRYFPEPDIPPILLSEETVAAARASLPEMAEEKGARYRSQLGLSGHDADFLTADKALCDLFEATVALGSGPKQVCNWLMGPLMAALAQREAEPREVVLSPRALHRLLELLETGRLNRKGALALFEALLDGETDMEGYIRSHRLEQVSDPGLVRAAVEKVLTANPQSVADYRAGKEKAFGFLMGRAMGELKGKADPKAVTAALRERLEQE